MRDQPPAESVEKRPVAKGNPEQATVLGTQGPAGVLSALGRVREAACVSASDPRQEPGAVIPHAGICVGGCRATGIPTATKVPDSSCRT